MSGPETARIVEFPALPAHLSGDVLALAVRAAAHDGVKPLSEQTVLAARRLPQEAAGDLGAHVVLLEPSPPGTEAPHEHGTVLGYGYVDLGDAEAPSGELVIDPEHRRRGLGGRLLDHVLSRWPGVRLWSHGDLQDARRLYTSRSLRVVRELWQMSRPLRGEWSDLPEEAPQLPDGLLVRPYHVGDDDEAWLAVNSRAFATHPEQGRMTLADLQDRQGEPWFDPSGFLIVEDTTVRDADGRGRVAAFHWTKVEDTDPHSGEVYVVGVDPDYQGRGLGRAVTLLGLQHLRSRGIRTATLYVDGDNTAAIATYHRLGFERSAIDVMYAAGGSEQ